MGSFFDFGLAIMEGFLVVAFWLAIFEIVSEIGLSMMERLMGGMDRMGSFTDSRLALIEGVGVMILAFGLATVCIVEVTT